MQQLHSSNLEGKKRKQRKHLCKGSLLDLRRQKPKETPKKGTKKTSSGLRKRRKTLQISSLKFEEETSDRPVEPVVQEVKTSVGRRA